MHVALMLIATGIVGIDICVGIDMNIEEARKILEDAIKPDCSLSDIDSYDSMEWPTQGNASQVYLDGIFTVKHLKAIVWWMENIELK